MKTPLLLAISLASILLVSGCATPASKPDVTPQLGYSEHIRILPPGPATNVLLAATAPGVRYRIITDDQGLLYLMGILPHSP